MSRFEEVADRYDPDVVTEAMFDHWEAVDAYERTKANREGAERFFFVDGPPYTSGAAHMGTTWNKTLKDAYIRYLRMSGYDVTDRPGYDMHGLPIETRVEERLGFENKKDIEAFGMEKFIAECKEYANEQLEGLQSDFKSFGVWMDWENPYKTVSPEYMEAAWWAFSRAADRGLVEQGNRSISQCPRCETAIANNEVEYDDVEDPSIYVTFDLIDRDGSLVAWTTTPWTVPANTFVAVSPDLTYQAVRGYRETEAGEDSSELLWIAQSCVEDVLERGGYESYEIIEEVAGEEMTGWAYEHPLSEQVPEHASGENALRVYPAEYVEADRTGLVHSAPGHGEEDFERGRELGFEAFCPVGTDGIYTDAAGKYEGTFVREANAEITDDLDADGRLFAAETYAHSYGHCWRCDTGIVQIVTDQWFLEITEVKGELLENIDEAEWHPEWARDNRFRDFVENAPDWNVSRQRYWGIPLPIWVPESEAQTASEDASGQGPRADTDSDHLAEDMIVIGSREELADRADGEIDSETIDLHRPTVDDITITENGTTYHRVPDVFDVWIDSSVASWATLGYPGESEEFEELWPADLIMEAHDQTRGWFWSQLGMGTAAFEQSPYERVLMHGYALMPDGRGMSKSKDITVEPSEVLAEHGADAMRTFLLSMNPQGEDVRFSWEGTEEMKRRLNILWNVFRFPLPYMRLDGFDPDETTLVDTDVREGLETVDRWVLSRLQSTKAEMEAGWDEYRQDRAITALMDFIVEDVSRFYVQVVRERMWAEADSNEKQAAYATIYHVLREVVALLAPFGPFVAESIYTTLAGEDEAPTVHMLDYPTVDEEWRDASLETEMAVVRAVEEAGSAARQQNGRKLRWPVSQVVVDGDTEIASAIDTHRDLVADRLNARAIEPLGGESEWSELRYSADADMSIVGPEFGERAGEVANALNEARIEEQSLGALERAVEERAGPPVGLTEAMVTFVTEPPAETAAAPITIDGEERGTVYIDTEITEGIEAEGFAREVIRRVQEMRKDLDLDMDAEIRLAIAIDDDRIADLVSEYTDLIEGEVRATEQVPIEAIEDEYERDWEVEGVNITIAIEPLAEATA
jgi:isoleucyl-tRNA synthetase